VIHYFNIETDRTFLRPLHENDAQAIFDLNSDADVLKYTGDEPFDSIESSRKFIQQYDQYKLYGVGRLAVVLKSNNQFIGWCGLKFTAEIQEYDIGFRFLKSYWNQGFAKETAVAVLYCGFNQLHLSKIIGRSRKENLASIKVLEHIGMKYHKDFIKNNENWCLFELNNNEYTNQSLR